MVPPIFVRFTLFLTSTYFKILIHAALTIEKFKILEGSIEGDPPAWHPLFYSRTSPP